MYSVRQHKLLGVHAVDTYLAGKYLPTTRKGGMFRGQYLPALREGYLLLHFGGKHLHFPVVTEGIMRCAEGNF